MSFTINPSTEVGPECFNACNTCSNPHAAGWPPANRRAEIISAIVDDLRRAWSAAQKRKRLSTNAAEMNDSCQSPGNYEKFTDNQAMLFRRVEGRVAESAQCRTTSEGATQFDCLANLWSDQAGRQRRAPVCRAYYILGFLVREVRRPC